MCTIVFFQAEDGIRDLVRSRGLGDVYKRQVPHQPNLLLQNLPRAMAMSPTLRVGTLARNVQKLSLIHI